MACAVLCGSNVVTSGTTDAAEGWRASTRGSEDVSLIQVARPQSRSAGNSKSGGLLSGKLGSWLPFKQKSEYKPKRYTFTSEQIQADLKASGAAQAPQQSAAVADAARNSTPASSNRNTAQGQQDVGQAVAKNTVRAQEPSAAERQLLQGLRQLNQPGRASLNADSATVADRTQSGTAAVVTNVSFESLPELEAVAETAVPLIPVAEPAVAVPEIPTLKAVDSASQFVEAAPAVPVLKPAIETAEPLVSESQQMADSLAPRTEVADHAAASSHAPAPQPYGNGYRRRMAYVMQDEESSVCEIWHEHSLQWNARNRHVSDKFVEFYDPELVQPYDTDDYHMPVVVTAGNVQSGELMKNNSRSELLSRKITDIRPSLNYAWRDINTAMLPDDFNNKMDYGTYERNQPPLTVLQWAPTNFWHYPLYFEDPALERYGHTYHPAIQPFASSGKFFGQLVGLPYQMTLHPVNAREYSLGWYRPGEWAPKKKYQIPFNQEAATIETLTIVGLFFLIP
jgi:hypothetical protein